MSWNAASPSRYPDPREGGGYSGEERWGRPPPGYPQASQPQPYSQPVPQGMGYGASRADAGATPSNTAMGVPIQQQQPGVGRPVGTDPAAPQTGVPVTPNAPFSAMRIQSLQQAAEYRNEWQTSVARAPLSHCLWCCYSVLCPPCASFAIRKQILGGDMSRYRCCGGMMPCSGRCGEEHCPSLCLFAETCCCFANSVMVSRFMIQDELRVANGPCDNCLIATMLTLQYLSCVCSCVAMCTGNDEIEALADILNLAADLSYCTVCSCIQAQHRVELNVRDGKWQPLNPNGAAARIHQAPPQQQYMAK